MTLVFTGPPTIITHPTSHWIIAGTNTTLICEAIGKGSITYQWETSNINREQWTNISNSSNARLSVLNLERSHQYRCVVSNEVGRTRSNTAVVTVLSKSMLIYSTVVL